MNPQAGEWFRGTGGGVDEGGLFRLFENAKARKGEYAKARQGRNTKDTQDTQGHKDHKR